MRRLAFFVALAILLALPAFSAARRDPAGAGGLSVRRGHGEIMLKIKGALIARMATGKLRVTNGDPYSEQQPEVRGVLRGKPKQPNATTTVYKGRRIGLRIMHGKYRLRFDGKGIHLSAVGRGWVIFDGNDRRARNGVYSLNGDPYVPIPAERTLKLKIKDSSVPAPRRSRAGRVAPSP